MKKLAGACFVLLRGAVAVAAAQRVDPEREKAALMRTDQEFSDAAQKIGVGEAFVRYADEEATMMPPGEHFVTGLDAVRKQFAGSPKGSTLVWKPFKADVAGSRDLG
ncbi:MAG: hypothetical protein ACRD3M_01095 [Thermoanaerobaculia bacterium]